MWSIIFTLAYLTIMFTLMAYVCGSTHQEYGFFQNIKETFAPTNWRQFLFPACPFCWVARASALTMITLTILQLTGHVSNIS